MKVFTVHLRDILCNSERPLKERFRALFSLRNLNDEDAIDAIVGVFTDRSALLKHECAYCLGQMQNPYAVPFLLDVLNDTCQEVIVRHEAGEALGAISLGSDAVISALQLHAKSNIQELAETCQLAVEKIQLHKVADPSLSANPYLSVDPAPPAPLPAADPVDTLKSVLLDANRTLFERYRALFALRNVGGVAAADAISAGLFCGGSGALFRHEVAYVLGQMREGGTSEALSQVLRDAGESGMVRHECAEALGSIATAECMRTLGEYADDPEVLVRESCEVALDMGQYENSCTQFNFVDDSTGGSTTNNNYS